ncbi:MAG: hypothetical protein K1Y01_16695 [Vicinamibacteria bacterium]|nr:hypothetical protein [Vicinamibacteria bacterium]
MRSIFDATERGRIAARLERLTPAMKPRWGRMTPAHMVCHLIDAVESSGRPSPEEVGRGLLASFPIKQLVIYVLPWPKAKLQSPPDLLATKPGSWFEDVERLRASIEEVGRRGASGNWPASEVFGALSGAEWGALLRTHIDHHFRQFGV